MVSHLRFGPHKRSTDIADLLIPQFVFNITLYLDVRVVLDQKEQQFGFLLQLMQLLIQSAGSM